MSQESKDVAEESADLKARYANKSLRINKDGWAYES